MFIPIIRENAAFWGSKNHLIKYWNDRMLGRSYEILK